MSESDVKGKRIRIIHISFFIPLFSACKNYFLKYWENRSQTLKDGEWELHEMKQKRFFSVKFDDADRIVGKDDFRKTGDFHEAGGITKDV